jgi:hypothetical protein
MTDPLQPLFNKVREVFIEAMGEGVSEGDLLLIVRELGTALGNGVKPLTIIEAISHAGEESANDPQDAAVDDAEYADAEYASATH